MQISKRIWSLIVVVAMICSIFTGMPLTVFADDELDSLPLGISITSDNSYTCTEGEGGTFQVTAEGAENIEYALDGEPVGVSIDDTGLLTVDADVPADEYAFTITAGDAEGVATEAVQSFALTVEAKAADTSSEEPKEPAGPVGVTPMALLSAASVTLDDGSQGADYDNLADAVANVNDGGTITMLSDLTDTVSGTVVVDKEITIDLAGFTLEVENTAGDALRVTGGEVKLDDSAGGEFNVTTGTDAYGVYARDGGKATVSNATANSDYSKGAYAEGTNSTVTVTGDAAASGIGSRGAYADNGGTVTVSGDATADGNSSKGAYAVDGGLITVGGNATAIGEDSAGAWADSAGSEVTVTGSATAVSSNLTVPSYGAYAYGGGTVTVGVDATATGDYSYGAWAEDGGSVTVGGNATASGDGSVGAFAYEAGSEVTVGGNATATGDGSYGAYADGVNSEITVTDDASGDYYGAYAFNGGYVDVGGNATATGTGTGSDIAGACAGRSDSKVKVTGNVSGADYGAYAYDGGEATIDGTVSGTIYIQVGSTSKTQTPYPPIANRGGVNYYDYTDNNSNVYVKVPATAVGWSGLTANGSSGSTTTTQLTLTFDVNPTTLSAGDITVTGATKGALTGTGTTRTLAISNITVANGANVTVSISNPTGYTISGSPKSVPVYVAAAPTVSATPVISTNLPTLKSATVGDTVTLSVAATVSDGGTLSYQWKKGAANVGGNSNTLTINNAQTTDSGSYQVVVTNTKGALTPASADSATCALTVSATPATTVNWTGLTANGTSGSVTTTALTLTFSADPTTLDEGNIVVTGADKGTLSGSGLTRTMAISNISVPDGANVTVDIANPTDFAITPSQRTVAVNVATGAATYTITFNANGGSVNPASMSTDASGKLASLPTPTRSGSYRFDGWYTASSGGTQITTNTVFTSNTTVYAHWTYTGGTTGGSDSSGGSGGGGGGSSVTTTSVPTTTWLEQNPAGTSAGDAKEKKQDYVRTRSTGTYGVRGNAWAKFAGLKYEHDTVADGAVQVRMYINNPEKLTKDTMVSGYVKGSAVDSVRGIFEKWFKNKVRVVHFDQQTDWGQPVQIAAKLDLSGMDTKNLTFYSYDKATNSYKRIEKPAYWIDKNGYLHFTTEYAGDIIISEGPLERK